MTWEDEYSDSVLKEGYLLYRDGYIKSKTKKGSSYNVKVGGYNSVNVKVDVSGESYKAQCGCWDFRWRKECSHVVAAIYSIADKPEDIPLSATKIIDPFAKNTDDGEYHYFSIKKITEKIKVTSLKYQKAINMIENNEVSADIQTFGYNDAEGKNFTGLRVLVDIHDKASQRSQNAVISVGKDFFWKGTCNVRKCFCEYDYNIINYSTKKAELCEHMLAALIKLQKHIEEENPGDETDYKAMQFLGRFRSQKNSVSEKQPNIFLEPELQNDNGELKVGFKIGSQKAYKVKNMMELVEKAENNETLVLGKTGAINFSISEFDDKSKPFFEFIRNKVRDVIQRNERIQSKKVWGYYDRHEDEKISDTIILEGSALDEIYEICCGLGQIQTVNKAYRKDTTKSTVKFVQGMPKVGMRINELKDGQETVGISINGKMPNVFQGAQGIYALDDKNFYKASQEEYENLRPLLDFSGRDGSFSFNVGRRHLAEFYHSVYPKLQSIAKIKDQATEKIEKFIPPNPEFVFYLDSVDNMLSCRADVTYNDKKHSPMDSKSFKQYSQIYRDYLKEKEVCETIQKYFPVYDEETKESHCDDTEKCYRVYQEGIDQLLQLGEIQCTDSFQNRKIRKNFGVKIGVSVESDLLNLDLSSSDLSKEDLIDIFNSYRLKKKYHVLRNGDFVDLDSPDMDVINQIISACKVELKDIIGDKIKVPMYRALYLDKLMEEHEELYGYRDRNFRRLIKDFGTIKDSDIEIPKALENTLRPYQEYGHKWIQTIINNNFGGILADEMGLGKTLQIISVLLAKKTEEIKPALVVAPASLVYNWKEEFIRFAPELKVTTVAGGAKERHAQIHNYKDYDVLITSYDLLKRDIAEYQDAVFEYQIIDEAQYIKNSRTAASKTVKVINAKHRFALTGTPIENRLSELWSIFDFVMPGFLNNYETFKSELETPIVRDKDEKCSQRLKKLIAPFVLRRLKKDVLKDLPEKIEEIRYGVMEEEQRKIYDAQVLRISNQIKQESEAEFKKNQIKILAEITRARQLCCDPSLVIEDYNGGSAKREACIDLIQSAIEGEHRILLFSQFTTMLKLLEDDLNKNEIPYYKLTGDTPKEERIRLMKAFNEGSIPVFLISLKAGGTGLNLTGADVVIHYDPWWNISVQNQATDRAHRIGQTQNVTVYKLIIKGSIEEKILKLQEAKKNLADEVLNGENGTLNNMSKEELLELLS